ncbi:MAG: hypothetical protein QW331_01645 [Candidatus Woesearchaeota archaeon]
MGLLTKIKNNGIDSRIIWILANKYPLSAKEIYEHLKISYSQRVSYQYIHRIAINIFTGSSRGLLKMAF